MPNEKPSVRAAVDLLFAAYPGRRPPDGEVDGYVDHLRGVEPCDLVAAVLEAADRWVKWPPSAGELKARAREIERERRRPRLVKPEPMDAEEVTSREEGALRARKIGLSLARALDLNAAITPDERRDDVDTVAAKGKG